MDKIKYIPVLYKGIVISVIITILFTCGFITGAMTAALREEPLNVNVFLPAKQVAATEAPTTVPPTTMPPSTTAVPTTAAPATTQAETTTEAETTAPAEETEDEPCCIIGCLTKIIEFIKGILDSILSLLSSF